MKKLFLLVMFVFLISGCGNKAEYDLKTIQTNLSNLTYNDKKMFAENCADMEIVKDKYGLNMEDIKESIICVPSASTSSSMYAIFLIENDNGEKHANEFIEKYKASWMMDYLPEEKKLVSDMLVEKKGNYLIYIVSHDNQKALEIIK